MPPRWRGSPEASLARCEGLAGRLDRRAAEGRVRVCHGDLHLQNICLFKGEPTIFDCIEFNRELSDIDVLYDLAFLLMDLDHRGHGDLANTVFNRYLDRRDEADGVAALPLLLSMRAAIRAHVSGQAAMVQADAAAREQRRGVAAAYLEHALSLLAPAGPRLLAVGGFSGTGKSTLAYGLAPGLDPAPGARVLRSDVLRKRRYGVAPERPCRKTPIDRRSPRRSTPTPSSRRRPCSPTATASSWTWSSTARRTAPAPRRWPPAPTCLSPASGSPRRATSSPSASAAAATMPPTPASPCSTASSVGTRGRWAGVSSTPLARPRRSPPRPEAFWPCRAAELRFAAASAVGSRAP
ncbi:MAG: phosphotransferase [Arhodomonas sp.]|nr:phosphotransferase [Arhodomonas sp.]